MNCSTPGLPVHHQLRSSLRLTFIESMMPSSHLILCRPLPFLPPIPPSIRVFSNESTLCMRWPKYWSFSFSIIPAKKNPRVDLLQNGLVGSPCSPRDPQESSSKLSSINHHILLSSCTFIMPSICPLVLAIIRIDFFIKSCSNYKQIILIAFLPF